MKVETVAEQLLFTTIRIEAGPGVGTGFIVRHRWAEDKEGPFLITNKHVVDDAEKRQLTFTLAEQTTEVYGPSLGQSTSITLSRGSWNWVGHPSVDIDIAALPLRPILKHLEEIGKAPYYVSIHTDTIPAPAALDDLDAVEEILFVGYPNGVYDRVNNLPIVRRGTTATHPRVDYEGQAVFLIDASVFQGSSGSPVLIHDNGSWRNRYGDLVAKQRVYLLGILGKAYSRQDDSSLIFEEISTAAKPVIRTTQMIDLGVVYKAKAVIETIEHMLHQRRLLAPENSIG